MKIQTNPTTYKYQMSKVRRDKFQKFCNEAVFWVNLTLFWVLIAGIVYACEKVA